MKKTFRKLGLFKNKSLALKSAKQRRKFAANDISPNFTTFYKVERTKNPKNPKKPSYYVVMTKRKKSKKSNQRAKNNRNK